MVAGKLTQIDSIYTCKNYYIFHSILDAIKNLILLQTRAHLLNVGHIIVSIYRLIPTVLHWSHSNDIIIGLFQFPADLIARSRHKVTSCTRRSLHYAAPQLQFSIYY